MQNPPKKICLNMIVKNESKIIQRCLNRISKYIDYYCICDIGSTDDTIELIREHFKKCNPPIPGEIIFEPFKNIEYNRDFAFKYCESINVDYILLLDADMLFNVNPKITKDILNSKLHLDAYQIFGYTTHSNHTNIHIVKNNHSYDHDYNYNYKYLGFDNDIIKLSCDSKIELLSDIKIFHVQDGHQYIPTSLKNEKEINIEKECMNNNILELANEYELKKNYIMAIKTYKKYIDVNGKKNDLWSAYYNIGNCFMIVNDELQAMHWWLEACEHSHLRIDNILKIITINRTKKKFVVAYNFYVIARHMLNNIINNNSKKKYINSDDKNYINDMDFKIDYELSIIGYHCNYHNYNLTDCLMKLLSSQYIDDDKIKSLLIDCIFYIKPIIYENNNEIDSIHNNNYEQKLVFNFDQYINLPHFFKFVRDSTCGIIIDDEFWFVFKFTTNDFEYNYHTFVVVNKNSYELVRYTPLFVFEKEKNESIIEFNFNNIFVISYKINDDIMRVTIQKNTVENMMVKYSHVDH